MNRLALERFYQAIADAEDNPNIYYDVVFQIGGGILGDVYVHPLEVRRDAQTEKGDSLCIFFSGSDINADPIELVDRLLQLSNPDADIVSESWGFDSTHPILGTPRNWQAAVTSVPACYLAALQARNWFRDLPYSWLCIWRHPCSWFSKISERQSSLQF